MRPTTLLSIAGYLAAFTAAVHTFAGTYEVHAPLLNSTLPKALALLLYACWHLVTAAMCLSAWALLRPPEPRTVQSQAVLAGVIGILWVFFGFVFIAVALLFGGIALYASRTSAVGATSACWCARVGWLSQAPFICCIKSMQFIARIPE